MHAMHIPCAYQVRLEQFERALLQGRAADLLQTLSRAQAWHLLAWASAPCPPVPTGLLLHGPSSSFNGMAQGSLPRITSAPSGYELLSSQGREPRFEQPLQALVLAVLVIGPIMDTL
eukprot:scaffold111434_cov63-Phaeocystis_antarctica.AAC.3